MNPETAFVAVIDHAPLLTADACFVLCGEDGLPRAQVGAQIMVANGAGVLVLSGGVHEPPHILGAKHLHGEVFGLGVAPDRVKTEEASTNTREQAVACIAMAKREGWKRILIVASPYHVYRAYLTFLRVILDKGLGSEIQMIPVGASHTFWHEAPSGTDTTRLELLAREFAKIEEYADHVATYAEALDYVKAWEGR